MVLVIGGPDGLDPAFRQAAHERIRLSDLTLPHAFEALLLIYGPFNYGCNFTSESNARFDASLRSTHPQRGLRDFEAVNELAALVGLHLLEDIAMPSNNRCLVWTA